MASTPAEFDREELAAALSAALQVIAAQGNLPSEYHQRQYQAAFQRALERGDVDQNCNLTDRGLARTKELLKARRN